MRTPIALAVLMLTHSAWAASADEDDLALAYGDTATVSVATGSAQSLRRAPAVASVFTAEDIRAMGARDLREVLNRVPGFHVSVSPFIYEPRYQVRGVHSTYNSQTLVMIDGVRRQSIYFGSAETIWSNFPLANIARVEVIRGPGSALYGADAFAAVISITTTNAADMMGVRMGADVGSQGEIKGRLQFGHQVDNWKTGAFLQVGRSDGPDNRIEADAQTALDALFGTKVSRAPAPLHMGQRELDFAFDASNGPWQFRAKHRQRNLEGTMNGLANALSPNDRIHYRHTSWDIAYVGQALHDGWSIEAHLGGEHSMNQGYYQLFPPGAFGGQFPEGMVGTPDASPRATYLQGSATRSFGSHRVRVGFGWSQMGISATEESKNFVFVIVPGIGPFPAPLGKIVNARSVDGLFLDPLQRTLTYVLAQDEWELARDWTLTLGLRHDRYSDFGGTTNPRAALVWDARHDLTVKLLHGEAFRAPAAVEMYLKANPVALGNPNVQPERMTTSELVFDWQAAANLHGTLNLFSYRMSDILRAVPNADPFTGNTFTNLGEQTGRGFETEWRWKPRTGLQMVASYSQQDSRDGLTDAPVADTPQRMVKLALDWQLASAWGTQLQARHVTERRRAPGDARPPVADLSVVDLALRWNHLANRGWSATLSVNNLLDRDLREPSPAPGSIPFDFPLPGRQVVLQSQYRF